MKRLKYIVLAFVLSFSLIPSVFAGCDGWFNFSSNCETKIPYCQGNECTSTQALIDVKKAVNNTLTDKPLSQYAQDVVTYLLGFVSIIAVIYIIYAGFQLMIGAGDEEKMKKMRQIIIYVIAGIVIMWLSYGIVKWVIGIVNTRPVTDTGGGGAVVWSLVPEVSASQESDVDTFRDYQGKLKVAIQNLEAELQVNGVVSVGNIQSIKSLVQAAYDRLPDTGAAASENDTAKRAVDMYLDIAMKSPNSNQKVGDAISKVAAFIDGVQISSITGDVSVTPNEGNAPLTTSFLAVDVVDPSGTTPGNNNYIWWVRENGGVRRELGRGPSLAYTFLQEGTFTVNLDVISGSRNKKGKIDVLPLTVSKTVSVKPKLGEIILLVNGVNVSNIDSLKINPNLGKMGIVLDATASRAIGNGVITKTTWDFGNNNEISYKGKPIVERQVYANQGIYDIQLSIETNDGKIINKKIQLIVRDPSAVIQLDKETVHIGEDLHMSAVSYFTSGNNVEYSWQIQNDSNQKVLKSAAGNALNFKFDTVGKYIVTLNAKSPNGNIDSDSRIISVESREPVVNLETPISMSTEKPNVFRFDASKSYDPDSASSKGLTYSWKLDGQAITLDRANDECSKGSLTFDSIGSHTIAVTVANAYGKVTTVEKTFSVDSILSVAMAITPQVAPIGNSITFIAQSKNADFYEWNFGDGSSPESGNQNIVSHVFQKTGIYNVTLTVRTQNDNKTNQTQERVYITDTDSPFAIINVSNSSNSISEDIESCGTGAFVVNRSESTTLDGSRSVDIDGNNTNLSYTWSYFGKTKTTSNISEKFGDLGCFPIKLTVRSNKNGATHTSTEYLYIKNQPPEITNISTNIDTTKQDSQKILVKVTANGAKDPDGVITSYIWYYTTESDTERQNVQITQKPEITFVLPNITEKYYFGVVLEDNDGARMDSSEKSNEQVPLIIANQNGNIYLPLISLSTPTTAVFVGDSVHFSASAKTIVGTDITSKAEYAWDFDGDGVIDQKTPTPSIDHIYKNSGTYTMKVRVTYNGVSNTKYQTIYVKNPLKAHVQGYRLTNGNIYLLNASNGVYDKALWTIDGVATESMYGTTLDGNTISGDSIGTLTVSNNSSDVDSTDITLADIEDITGSGVLYQSYPKAENDTIHINGSSDKVILTMLGNTATRYAIDTNTSIDSDLDGIPDNDADNKELASYNDGSAFVIKDFTDVRVHEQEMKLTLFQGTTPIATRSITLVFDFITQTSTASGEINLNNSSGSISNYDRAKLDELSDLIHSVDDTNRIVLMQQYNLLIENWTDSFEKAKSLIDLQITIDNSDLASDKKSAFTTVINDLLVGDSQSTDDVTLAARLIDGLVSKSPNYEGISSKLVAIESHPQSLESNAVLAEDIFNLIQSDDSLDAETKKYIYNQLSVIKHGGTQSVPVEEIQDPTGGGSSGILGFISGVVKVFLLIIVVILVVILIGYGIYRLTRKNDAIGFQDFLIDSVFHSRKGSEDTPLAGTKPAPAPAPAPIKEEKKEDPMAAFMQPKNTSDTADQSPVIIHEPSPEQDPLHYHTIPSPAVPPQESSPLTSATPVEPPVEPLNAGEIPEWLKPPSYSDDAPIEEEVVKPTTEEAPITNPEPTGDIPDWLKGNTDLSDDATTPETPIPESIQSEQSEDVLPDTPISPIVENQTPEDSGQVPANDEPVPENQTTTPPAASPDIPSWLMDSVTETTPPQTTAEKSTKQKSGEKKGGKKKEKTKTPEEETLASTSEKPTTSVAPEANIATTPPSADTNIPDWLK